MMFAMFLFLFLNRSNNKSIQLMQQLLTFTHIYFQDCRVHSVQVIIRFQIQFGIICTSEFFKKLKLHEPLWRGQFQLFEKLTCANCVEEVPEDLFSHSRKLFSKFSHKIFIIILSDIIGTENFLFQLIIINCTGVRCLALVLNLNCIALSHRIE